MGAMVLLNILNALMTYLTPLIIRKYLQGYFIALLTIILKIWIVT